MSVHQYTVKDGSGNDVALSEYDGKVLLIVNTATKCGLTPQYEALESMYKKFNDRGFEILDFPSNQFLNQAPGTDEEIAEFCQMKYGTTFQTFSKIDVNGENAAPLFTYLKSAAKHESDDSDAGAFRKILADLRQSVLGDDIKWNFTKFLVDRNGIVVGRFGPTFKPADIESRVEALL